MTAGLDSQAPTPIGRLFAMRLFIMLSYSMTYIAVPALLFQGTKSLTIAGGVLLVEGIVRATLSLGVRRIHAWLGSRRAIAIAECSRVLGAVGIGICVLHFHVVLLLASSCAYQLGYLLVVLEQELRCGQQAEKILKCQAYYRVAEVVAVYPVLAAALAFAAFSKPLLPLIGLGGLMSVTHLVLARQWLRHDLHAGDAQVRVREGLAALLRSSALVKGLAASTLAYTMFNLVLAAAPFLLQGQSVFGLDLTKQAGLAVFKVFVATAAMGSALLMGRSFGTNWGNSLLFASGVIAPLALVASQASSVGAMSLAALVTTVALAVGVIVAQRSYRQESLSEAERPAATAVYLAVECLSMSLAGAVLLSGQIQVVMLLVALTMAALHWKFPRRSPEFSPA